MPTDLLADHAIEVRANAIFPALVQRMASNAAQLGHLRLTRICVRRYQTGRDRRNTLYGRRRSRLRDGRTGDGRRGLLHIGRLYNRGTGGGRGGQAAVADGRLNARTRLLRDLPPATTEFAGDAAGAAGATPIPQLTEALHLLLDQLAALADADDAAMLLELTGERGAMMRRLRAAGSDGLAPKLLHRATATF